MSYRNSYVHVMLSSLLAGYALLCGSGCKEARNAQPGQIAAPGIGVEGRGDLAKHNLADPNGPFYVSNSQPRLVAREPLLDVNGVPTCEPAQLNLFESRAQAAGAHHTLRLTLANTGSACRLGGFPSITLLGSDGAIMGTIRIRKVSNQSMAASLVSPAVAQQEAALDAPSPLVLLPNKGEAAFELGWTSGPDCRQASEIAIAAPGSTKTTVISRVLAVCEDQILITAVTQTGPD